MSAELYEELGAGYDVVIRWESRLARETPFYQDLFARHQVRTLLDVGSGTGWHARLFAEWGLSVVGLDPSAAMIARAQEVTAGLPVRFVQGGFDDLPAAAPGPFDAVVCLGNTLPHATTPASRMQALRAFRECLAGEGVCVIQTLNYDHFAAARERFQPLSQGQVGAEEQILLRMFDFGPETWQFHILRFARPPGGEWRFSVSSATHLPVFGADLARQLAEAGFRSVRLLGGFDGSGYDPDSSDMLLAVAVR